MIYWYLLYLFRLLFKTAFKSDTCLTDIMYLWKSYSQINIILRKYVFQDKNIDNLVIELSSLSVIVQIISSEVQYTIYVYIQIYFLLLICTNVRGHDPAGSDCQVFVFDPFLGYYFFFIITIQWLHVLLLLLDQVITNKLHYNCLNNPFPVMVISRLHTGNYI